MSGAAVAAGQERRFPRRALRRHWPRPPTRKGAAIPRPRAPPIPQPHEVRGLIFSGGAVGGHSDRTGRSSGKLSPLIVAPGVASSAGAIDEQIAATMAVNVFLAGDYFGATDEATVGAGLGANVLLGGSNRTVALQPISLPVRRASISPLVLQLSSLGFHGNERFGTRVQLVPESIQGSNVSRFLLTLINC